MEYGHEALVAWESVRDWNISMATNCFLAQVREVTRDGLWFNFRVKVDGEPSCKHVEEPEVGQRQRGERWYDNIGLLQDTALCKTRNTRLIAAALTSSNNDKTPRLVVITVGESDSLLLFAN
jgi:hypothetical protein